MSEFSLEINHLCKNFGQTQIIRDLNLSVLPGERVAIIGPNGAGKLALPVAKYYSTGYPYTVRSHLKSTDLDWQEVFK